MWGVCGLTGSMCRVVRGCWAARCRAACQAGWVAWCEVERRRVEWDVLACRACEACGWGARETERERARAREEERERGSSVCGVCGMGKRPRGLGVVCSEAGRLDTERRVKRAAWRGVRSSGGAWSGLCGRGVRAGRVGGGRNEAVRDAAEKQEDLYNRFRFPKAWPNANMGNIPVRNGEGATTGGKGGGHDTKLTFDLYFVKNGRERGTRANPNVRTPAGHHEGWTKANFYAT